MRGYYLEDPILRDALDKIDDKLDLEKKRIKWLRDLLKTHGIKVYLAGKDPDKWKAVWK